MNDREPTPGQGDPEAHEREALLRAEIARLHEHMARATDLAHEEVRVGRRPSSLALWLLALVALLVIVGAFFGGYLPRSRRDAAVVAETRQDSAALPVVNTTEVQRAPSLEQLEVPGSIQAVTEAPILARADGYLKRRLVDIGDRVTAGQLLAEIEAPELDQQVAQAKAAVQQALAAQEQTKATLEQGKANEQLAAVTAQRWVNLLSKGAVSRQEHDQYQAQAKAQGASVLALERAVAAARSNVEAAQANLARLEQMQGYRQVRAPFAGVVTLRNIDTGALISSGQTLLYRISQTGTLRTYINVPQGYADDIRPGMLARLTFAELPGRKFSGRVARSASALDPGSRTLLAEIQLANTGGSLLPGMYCNVELDIQRAHPPLLIPGDTLMMRSQGPTVAVVTEQRKIHLQKLTLGRDFGKTVEVLSGLEDGQSLVANPNDSVREGVEVKPVKLKTEESAAPGKRG